MSMLRAGLIVGVIFVGAIAALLGLVIMLSALKTGVITIGYGSGESAISETIARTVDEARFWQFFVALGLLPFVGGILGARWGWRTINR